MKSKLFVNVIIIASIILAFFAFSPKINATTVPTINSQFIFESVTYNFYYSNDTIDQYYLTFDAYPDGNYLALSLTDMYSYQDNYDASGRVYILDNTTQYQYINGEENYSDFNVIVFAHDGLPSESYILLLNAENQTVAQIYYDTITSESIFIQTIGRVTEYDQGYSDGKLSGFNTGFDDGYTNGKNDGIFIGRDQMYINGSSTYDYDYSNSYDFQIGYNAGLNDSDDLAAATEIGLKGFIPSILGAVLGFLLTIGSIEFLGITINGLIVFLGVLIGLLMILKLIYGGGD